MDTKLALKIQKVIHQLQSIHDELTREIAFPKAAQELLDKKLCLFCKQPFLESERSVRGVHERCRKQLNAEPEEKLMELGLLAPPATSGRKKSPLLTERINEIVQSGNNKSARKKNN